MLPPEFHRQLVKGHHLELMKRAERNRQLKEIETTTGSSLKERLFLNIGNRLITIGESLKVLAEPRYNVPQGQP